MIATDAVKNVLFDVIFSEMLNAQFPIKSSGRYATVALTQDVYQSKPNEMDAFGRR